MYILRNKIKIRGFMILSLIIAAVLNIVVSASGELVNNKNYEWYFVPVSDNKQPRFDVDLEDLAKYDAYAIGNPDDKVIYLTFDFGYENGNVKKCLDILNKHEIKAAFFILENVVKTNIDLVKEIAETGHLVCNHTMKHKDMRYIKNFSEYEKEIIGLERLYEEKTGYKMAKYFRPPEGAFTKQNLEYNQSLGYKTIFWSSAYADWDEKKQPAQSTAIKTVLNRTHNGAVILLHPTSSTNAAILDTLIKEWKEQGYRFGTLDELTSSTSTTYATAASVDDTPVSSVSSDTSVSETKTQPPKSNLMNQRESVALGNILNSDIMAYINGSAIPSWSANNRTVVAAETLANYGFDVVWNDKDRTLKITYNPAKKFNPVKTERNPKKTGSIYCKYYTSNIRTYIAEKEIQAYNINGETFVDIEDLSAAYGSAVWDGTKREIKITLK